MKAKDTLLLINTITQNPNLARRVWFWHVSSHFIRMSYFIHPAAFNHEMDSTLIVFWWRGGAVFYLPENTENV